MIALAPAGRVRTSGQRSWSRCSVSLSPRGNTTFRCALSRTSGRSSTASTRLARRPGVMCPDSARSDARAVPPGPWEVTSAAATARSASLTSTCRRSSRLAMPAVLPRPGCPAGGSGLAPSGTVRSHGLRRSPGRGAQTAAGRAAGLVTVPGLLGLLTELTPGAVVLAAAGVWSRHVPFSLTITSRHRVPARDEGPHTGPGRPLASGGSGAARSMIRNLRGMAGTEPPSSTPSRRSEPDYPRGTAACEAMNMPAEPRKERICRFSRASGRIAERRAGPSECLFLRRAGTGRPWLVRSGLGGLAGSRPADRGCR